MKTRLALVIAGLVLLVSVAMPAVADTMYNFQTVISPSDPAFTQLLGINDSGTIAGYYGDGVVVPNHGFTLTLPNSYTSENFPGSAQTQVVGINGSGVTDGFFITTTGVTEGFIDNGGTFTAVNAPGTAFNQLLGINNNGEEAGYSSLDPTGATLQLAYVDNNGTFNYLTSFLPPGVGNNQATGINNSGEVSGFYLTNSGADSFGFLLNGTTLTSLEFPGSTFTQALGVNNGGEVVGFYIDSSGVMHGFTYFDGTYQSIDDPFGIGTTTINGINDQGDLVGFYVDGNDNTDGLVAAPSTVPEPASLLLFGTGLLGAAILWRRKLAVGNQ